MTISDVLDIIEIRCRSMSLEVDAGEHLIYLYQSLVELAGEHDYDAYTVLPDPGQPWFATSPGIEAYSLPGDFWRLIKPREERKYGVKLNDGSSRLDLYYRRPEVFDRLDRTRTGRPFLFTVIGHDFLLTPAPDSNEGVGYTVNGPYIRHIERPQPDDVVRFAEPKALISHALVRMVSDKKGGVPPNLEREAIRDQTVLANHQERQRIDLYDRGRLDRIGGRR